MEIKSLDKAMELYAKLIVGEEVSSQVNADLYEDYSQNAQVYDLLQTILAKSNLKIYEYQNCLYVSAGYGNRIFGYSNDELKKEIGLRLNKELFLAYYMIFETMILFYQSSGDAIAREYVKTEDVIGAVSAGLSQILNSTDEVVMSDIEENSFKVIALLWDELPMTAQNEDTQSLKAARGSKTGFVKLVFNFLKSQNLFFDAGDKYYATNRFRALVQNYYEDHNSRLFAITRGGTDSATY